MNQALHKLAESLPILQETLKTYKLISDIRPSWHFFLAFIATMRRILEVDSPNDYARFVDVPALHPMLSITHYDELQPFRQRASPAAISNAEVHAKQADAIRIAVSSDDMQHRLDRKVFPELDAAEKLRGKLVEADHVGVVREKSELKSLDAVFASQGTEVATQDVATKHVTVYGHQSEIRRQGLLGVCP